MEASVRRKVKYTKQQLELREKLKQRLLKDEGSFLAGRTASTKQGVFLFELQHSSYLVPLCTVWIRFIGKATIETLASFTHPVYRRLGLRTLTHKKMVIGHKTIDLIWSQTGTKEGTAWMIKAGWKECPLGWQYFTKENDGQSLGR